MKPTNPRQDTTNQRDRNLPTRVQKHFVDITTGHLRNYKLHLGKEANTLHTDQAKLVLIIFQI